MAKERAKKPPEKQAKKRASKPAVVQRDTLVTMADEIAEAAEILRLHHPLDDETLLRCRAESLRRERYERGRWPSSDELAIEIVWDEAHVENVIRKPDAI
jgi:hypothetical protein